MSEIYADEFYGSGDDGVARAGGVILVVISCLAAALVLAGLVYATGTSARHNAAILAADCEPSLFMSGLPCITQQMVLSRYEAIVTPASSALAVDTAAYQASERHNLVAAETALASELATEQALNNSLGGVLFTRENRDRTIQIITDDASVGNVPVQPDAVTFTPQMTVIANALLLASQALAKLTSQQARSTTLAQLRSFNPKVAAASAIVQTDIKLLHTAVAAPLPGS
jgi:hypothetical protein